MLRIQGVLFALVALATAQLADLPQCAQPCATNLPKECNLADVKCICSDSSWIKGISCCVAKACSPADQQKTLMVATQLCKTVSVTLPSAAGCEGDSSSSAVSGASSAVAGASGIASSAAAGASSKAASGVSAAGSSATGSSMMSSMSASTSSIGLSSPTTSTTAQSTGGAVQNLGSKMGAVGAAVAALALL